MNSFKKMKIRRHFSFLILFALLNIPLFSQEKEGGKHEEDGKKTDSSCTTPVVVHGEILVHLNLRKEASICEENIHITSLEEDGSSGTLVKGSISTSGKVRITSGVTRVRIVPFINHTIKTENENIGNDSADNSLKEETIQEKAIVYPNPVKNFVSIESVTKIVGYQLIDLLGKQIKEDRFLPTNSHTFSALELKKGMYILRLFLQTGKQQQLKIIKP